MAKRPPSIIESSNPYEQVGRLASLGIEHAWQAALYIPSSYQDALDCDKGISSLGKGAKALRRLILTRPATPVHRSPPRLEMTMQDMLGGSYKTTVFGDSKQWQDLLEVGVPHLYQISTKLFLGQIYVTIHKAFPDEFAGHVMPLYPLSSTKIIEQETLRKKIAEWLPQAIPMASQHISHQLQSLASIPEIMDRIGASGWTLEQLLEQVHYPTDSAYITPVRIALLRLAALGSLNAVAQDKKKTKTNPIRLATLDRRMAASPFVLTTDQAAAVRDMARELSSPVTLANCVIAGDVGTGKSLPIYILMAAAADAQKRSVMLFPTTLVAAQQYANFRSYYPDVGATLITGDTGGNEDLEAPVLMGTSALLHRRFAAPDILIVDEQHKFSRAQREKCRGQTTHAIELSATCLPRTQALMRYGHVTISQMRQTHKKKTIHTELWEGKLRARELTVEIKKSASEGHPVFIVYPQRSNNEAGDHRHNVEMAIDRWESLFPGKVRAITADNKPEEMEAALNDIREGRAVILLCTTVVEVGIDVDNLRHVVVIDPSRMGITALHQLRGRVARQGGEGWFDMLAPDGLPESARPRVEVLLRTTDGFEIAEEDLRLRGSGDLRSRSDRQSGADGNFLHGQKIDLEIYDQMSEVFDELWAARAASPNWLT